ncbi:glucosidase [uncultured Paludibaculum sp.]|uniref:MGH1-like glycoside hydrolase domain-containing protein n=1 Tax=uncultured Paludibaculum sp. TaxID=1765020 RepID=UPI002AAAF535|nr:glucosidase [uncultured Paludibaculum sp.]
MAANKGSEERQRLAEAASKATPWKKWGPYLSERQWGTVREDYSDNGNAWDYFTHDQARSRAYRWGEDGLAGISDDKQRLCFALALWNGRDPILKERLFGLTNSEGNHGEDVKEYYFYLDSTPTHSYMKYLYKYPQAEFPYADLVKTNRTRTRLDFEYELLDTGVFDEQRYFDVFVEYAKAEAEDITIRITVANRGPEAASLDVLPTLWFRNTWSYGARQHRPSMEGQASRITADHPDLGRFHLHCPQADALLFTENDTNTKRLWRLANPSPYVKDAFHHYLVDGDREAVNPAQVGTKAAALHRLTVEAGGEAVIHLRLTRDELAPARADDVFSTRIAEANDFYDLITPDGLDADQGRVMRQALAGMLWTKQYYFFDLDVWLEEHNAHPSARPRRMLVRNSNWFHMVNDDIISMPDKWEYPWYAAWDLAFHTTALAMVDLDFAKDQLDLMLRELYLHPNGQMPAYEWNFGDVNPPVHAWATLFVYSLEKERTGQGDFEFLKRSFHKLMLNFTWWVNRKDPGGRNVFEGGFLGLDNIGVFDRSSALPTGGYLEQADGTAWMALFAQNLFEISMELAEHDVMYEDFAAKFVEHFLWIASAMDRIGDNFDEMWDEGDGFFYDLLRLPDGSAQRLKVRSLVGLLPLCASTVVSPSQANRYTVMTDRIHKFLKRHPEVLANIAPIDREGVDGRQLLSILDEKKLRRVLSKMLDENEFFGPYGIRSLSRFHKDNPFEIDVHGEAYKVQYLPAESNNGMFGGNSNWRGPVWMPVNMLIVRALLQYYLYYGDAFQVECPTGSGHMMNLFEVTQELSKRLAGIFLRGEDGRRPVYGGSKLFQEDPHWRDLILFYEYFHGDNGAGLGASHQTGWTGTVARLIQLFGHLRAKDLLEGENVRPVTADYEDPR